jgi:LAO/AO transport system kinase
MLQLNQKKYEQGKWKPPILKTQAVRDQGIAEVIEQIENHAAYLKTSSGSLPFRLGKERVRQELAEMVKNRLIKGVFEQLKNSGQFEAAVTAIVNKETDPYTACERLIPSK